MFDSVKAADSRSLALDALFSNGAVPNEEKLLCVITFWSSFDRLAKSGKLTAQQITIANSSNITIFNRISMLYDLRHEYRWGLACDFLSLYRLRYNSPLSLTVREFCNQYNIIILYWVVLSTLYCINKINV